MPEEAKRSGSIVVDHELQAMNKIMRILGALDETTRLRIVGWLSLKIGKPTTTTPESLFTSAGA